MKNKKAFTLIELLVVIAIIGILATISVLALSNARAKSRDAKRAGDMKQIQTALELFFNDNNRYPTTEEWNTGKIYSTSTGVTSTYMQVIPTAPTPADGTCSSGQNTVSYTPTSDGSSYSISFCLGNTTGTLTPGPKCLIPSGILESACAISFSPTNLSGLQLWLKADAGVTTDVDSYVSEWSDQSGGGNNVTQAVSPSQPLLVNNVLNGKPVLRFDGTDDYLNLSNSLNDDNTIFIVAKANSINFGWIFFSYPTQSRIGITINYDFQNQLGFYCDETTPFNDVGTITSSSATFSIAEIKYKLGDYMRTYSNGNLITTSNDLQLNPINKTNNILIGSRDSAPAQYAAFDLSEIIIYNTALSDTDRIKVETYLNTKYNLY